VQTNGSRERNEMRQRAGKPEKWVGKLNTVQTAEGKT